MTTRMEWRIVVDDQDRVHAPEAPWTANLYSPNDSTGQTEEPITEPGFGTSPAEAVANLRFDFTRTEVDS